MTKHELILMQDTIKEIHDRMGEERISDFQYRDYSSQMTGIGRILNSIGYEVKADVFTSRVTIIKKGE